MKQKVNKKEILKTLRAYSMVIVLVAIAVLFHFLTEGLIFTSMNLTNLILQNSYVVILILGMLPVILTGNVDLSVGAILSFVGAVAAILQVSLGWGTVPTLVVSLLIGIAAGAWNGLWIAKFDIPPFIVTLSTQLALRGLTMVVLNGASIGPFHDTFRWISSSFLAESLGMDPFLLTMVLAVVACVVFAFVMIRDRKAKMDHGVPVKPFRNTLITVVVLSVVILALSLVMAANKGYAVRYAKVAARFRKELIAKYGQEKGSKIRYAEAFQVSEYGSPLTAELKEKLFNF